MKCDWRREQLGYLYRKRFDSKIAEADRKGGDRQGAVRRQKQVAEG